MLSKSDKAIAKSLINSMLVAQQMATNAANENNSEKRQLWANRLGITQLALNELLGIELAATECYSCNPELVQAAKLELQLKHRTCKG